MRLATRGVLTQSLPAPIIGRVTRRYPPNRQDSDDSVLLIRDGDHGELTGYLAGLSLSPQEGGGDGIPILHSVPDLDYLDEGDIVVLRPGGFVRSLYRAKSRHNFLLVAERCNSWCLMCSQPPRQSDDVAHLIEHFRTIDLMDPPPAELGITGGEPTLLGEHFIALLQHIRSRIPGTAVHVLTNGRLFAAKAFAKEVAAVSLSDLMLGIPLYSDVDTLHDYVVQVRGAYDETLTGLYNLAEAGVGVEIRVVVHRATYERLPHLADFIVRNLPFVQQVALMGLEVTGFARGNYDALWIDPVDYGKELSEAVEALYTGGVNVRLYNHPLCLIDRRLWRFAVPSISDWKAAFLPTCEDCAARPACGGVFATSGDRHSQHIRAVQTS